MRSPASVLHDAFCCLTLHDSIHRKAFCGRASDVCVRIVEWTAKSPRLKAPDVLPHQWRGTIAGANGSHQIQNTSNGDHQRIIDVSFADRVLC